MWKKSDKKTDKPKAAKPDAKEAKPKRSSGDAAQALKRLEDEIGRELKCNRCGARGTALHECSACEKAGAKFQTVGCDAHNEMMIAELQKHVSSKHP